MADSGASGKAVAALVLGILGIVGNCFPLGIVAIFLGKGEISAIDAGQSSPEGRGLAKAGIVLGWISVAILAIWLLFIFAFGGLAVLGAMMEAGGH